MKIKIIRACVLLLLCCAGVKGQQETATEPPDAKQRVPLSAQATADNAQGQVALTARLRPTALVGTPETPIKNVRFVVENSSSVLYRYVNGWVTFYDAEGVRCGGAVFDLSALAPGERAEADAPGLRLNCNPAAWRIIATSLITDAGETARRGGSARPTSAPANTIVPPLFINIDGERLPLQLGNPIEVKVGERRIKIIVTAAP